MGTALASFVAGALIVLTLFDQVQVTKVDDIQGSIREMRSKVQSWEGISTLNDMNNSLYKRINTQYTEALEESKDYSIYLEKESQKWKNLAIKTFTKSQSQKSEVMAKAISSTNYTINELEKLHDPLKNITAPIDTSQLKIITKEVIRLTLQTKLEKARVNAFELMMHLETKSDETKNSKEHYTELMQNIAEVNIRLSKMNASESLEIIDQELSIIESKIVPLKKQTPYTLFMMRAVEIGLPLFLSIFSVFFVLRYSLTEKRSFEIKELLRLRNLERSKENGNDSESTIN